jgi:hypothetical protein
MEAEMSNEKTTPATDYIWPALQVIGSAINIAGNSAAINQGDANDSPAFRAGLAASSLYAGAGLARIGQIYNARCEEAQTWVEREQARRDETVELREIVIQK